MSTFFIFVGFCFWFVINCLVCYLVGLVGLVGFYSKKVRKTYGLCAQIA